MADVSDAPLRVGLLGFGVVGQAVAGLISEQARSMQARLGRPILLQRVASRSIHRRRDQLPDLPDDRLGTNLLAVAQAPDVDVVVELIGGVTDARRAILAALSLGKPVVTANKALLAEHGAELFAAARKTGACLGFEASCAGAIPVIGALMTGLSANRVEGLIGILNGTCNHILTGMSQQAATFESMLAAAQQAGYAEADPTLDIEGHDAAHKLAVLASLAFGANVRHADVSVSGIRGTDVRDIRFGQELGYVLKLLAIGEQADDDEQAHQDPLEQTVMEASGFDAPSGAPEPGPRGPALSLRVHPAFLPASHSLARVDGATNAVYVLGSASGPIMLRGQGAGGRPTASAVLGDVIDVATGACALRFRSFRVFNDQTPRPALRSLAELVSRFYLRIQVDDRPGVLAGITHAFGEAGISLSALIQHEGVDAGGRVPLAIVTHRARRGDLDRAVRAITLLPSVGEPPVVIPIQEK